MSVVINTNSAATIAANNLARSNAQLQVSLNRLSSGSKIVNPSDDAGGLAVAMKLGAVANRQSALQSNLGDAVSYAQTQDGALQVAGSILDRISELATLAKDPTKNTTDLANYNDEFTQLQNELTAVGSETFNGISLFGTSTMSVATTDDLGTASAIGMAQQNLLGSSSSGTFSPFTENWANLSNWTVDNGGGGTAGVSGSDLNLNTNTSDVNLTTKQSFSGAFSLTTTFTVTGTNSGVTFSFGNTQLADLEATSYSGAHSLTISVDASGNSTVKVDGTVDPSQSQSGIDVSAASAITIDQDSANPGSAQLGPLTVTSQSSAPGNTDQVATAASLSSLSLSTITGAIQDVATMRAENGAEQSRLNFASTLLTTNQTNLEAAISRISDVDVAQETTSLAKWNVLVQAGTSMLTQANQSAQIALKLITG
jgi:flagellin